MRKVQLDDVVRVHYTGKRGDGTAFDSSRGKDPIEFKVGKGTLIPGFEKGVLGMQKGETKTVSTPPEDAYGNRQEELIARIDKHDVPATITPTVGMPLHVKGPDGQMIPVVVADIAEDTITIDANSPLAGETLIFDLEIVEFE
jgi:peptidylprolyl isomerase